MGTITRIGFNFLTGVLIVRTFGPENFGVYSLLLAVGGIGGVIVDIGMTEAAVKHVAAEWSTSRTQAGVRAQVFFWSRIITAGIGIFLGLIFAQPITTYLLNLPESAPLFALALLGIATTALNGSVNAILQATGNFSKISISLILSSALALVIAVSLSLAGFLTVSTAIVFVGAGTALTGFLIGWRLLPTDWGTLHSPLAFPGWPTLREQGGELLRFGSWLWIANILKVLGNYLDFFLLNLWLTPAVVGIYALAQGLAARAEIVNHSLYTVLIPMASALQGRAALWQYLRQSVIRGGVASLILLLVMSIAAWFIPFFYGGEFTSSIVLFQLLLGVVIFDILTLPILLLIYTFDRPDLSALAEGVRVVVLIGVATWLIPTLGGVGAIIAKFVAKLVGVLLTIVLLVQHNRKSTGLEQSN